MSNSLVAGSAAYAIDYFWHMRRQLGVAGQLIVEDFGARKLAHYAHITWYDAMTGAQLERGHIACNEPASVTYDAMAELLVVESASMRPLSLSDAYLVFSDGYAAITGKFGPDLIMLRWPLA